MSTTEHICDTEKIAAFIEGDLEADAHRVMEEHLAGCDRCTSEWHSQKVFMCELLSVFTNTAELTVPKNFARIVAVRAESDMRGVRNVAEHKRALRLCLVLALAAFALLGVSAIEGVFINMQSIGQKILMLLGLLGKTTYDAASGVAIILRVLSGGLVTDSRFAALTALLLVVLAVGMLMLLISRFHRARLSE